MLGKVYFDSFRNQELDGIRKKILIKSCAGILNFRHHLKANIRGWEEFVGVLN